MEEAIKLLPIRQWISFNQARKFHKAYFLSPILLSDGMNVDPNKAQLKQVAQNESSMVFPLEKPTSQDLALWKDVLCLLTSSPKLRLSPKLGKFLRLPYDKVVWLTNDNRTCVI
jgi:hypothetical protein